MDSTVKKNPTLSETTTREIRVTAISEYIDEKSDPAEDRYFYAYTITIANNSPRRVQLLSRHWIIIDSEGERQEVHGPGVIGKTPTLAPGESFTYTSFCILETGFGTMEGSYRFLDDEGTMFDVQIGRFYLATNAPRLNSLIREQDRSPEISE